MNILISFQFQKKKKIGFYQLCFRFLLFLFHYIPCISTPIPWILTLILCIPTLIPYIAARITRIPTLIPRVPTLIPFVPIIPLITIPDSSFQLLQIAS